MALSCRSCNCKVLIISHSKPSLVHYRLHVQSSIPHMLMAKHCPRDEDIQQLLLPIETATIKCEDRNCSICQEPFQKPGRVTRSQASRENAAKLPCGHIFGQQCITRWLKESDTCPQCRRSFPLHKPEPLTHSTNYERRFHHELRLTQQQNPAAVYERQTINYHVQIHTSGLLTWESEISALMQWVNTVEDPLELLNIYLSIVSVTGSNGFTASTEEGRRNIRIALDSLRHIRLFYHMRLFYRDLQRSSDT